MTERPILFNASMVRALLDGSKTQTRRSMKPQPSIAPTLSSIANVTGGFFDTEGRAFACPYGRPGDRLWVREACRGEELANGQDGVRYIADNAFRPIDNTPSASVAWLKLHTYRGHKGALAGPAVPNIHMPRWASRILLEITGVRVERLQEISDADAIAEGVDRTNTSISGYAKERYRRLWDQINGAGSWDANLWVWVVEFKRVLGSEVK